ncbi:hypothetical protein UlMin_014184 [Ulmus minor]
MTVDHGPLQEFGNKMTCQSHVFLKMPSKTPSSPATWIALFPATAMKTHCLCAFFREVVDADEVKLNTVLVVKAREVISIDGVVVDKNCEVDEKTLTGESFPVPKQIDSNALAGTINLNVLVPLTCYISVKTTALAEDCAFHLALVVFVIACPCGLILFMLVATFYALTKASTSGILIKGGDYLEILDKIKRLVSSIESKSSHPMVAVLVDYGRSLSFHNFPGEGIDGKIDGRDIYIGNKKIYARAACETDYTKHLNLMTLMYIYIFACI